MKYLATAIIAAGVLLGAVPGAPEVTSADGAYPSWMTNGTYTLTFSEPVEGVFAGVTWTPVSGTGTMGTIVQTDPAT